MAKKTVDKIQIEFKPIEKNEFVWDDGPLIKVNSYLSLENKMILFKNYSDLYFQTNDFVDNYINASYSLMLGVVDLCTNINVEKLDMDAFIGSGLWTEIKKRITNYNDVASDLYSIIKLYSEQRLAEQSIGTAFDRLSNSFIDFINKIDLSSEGIEKVIGQLQEATKEFDEKYKK